MYTLFGECVFLRITLVISILCGGGNYPLKEMCIGFMTSSSFILAAQGIECLFRLNITYFKSLICLLSSTCMMILPVLFIFYFHTMITNSVWQLMFFIGVDITSGGVLICRQIYLRRKVNKEMLIDV